MWSQVKSGFCANHDSNKFTRRIFPYIKCNQGGALGPRLSLLETCDPSCVELIDASSVRVDLSPSKLDFHMFTILSRRSGTLSFPSPVKRLEGWKEGTAKL